MEEHANDSCSVVYCCASAPDDTYELYHKKSPPQAAAELQNENTSLNLIYQNVRALLDEDQGGFNEVFVSSRADQCLDRLESYANSVPTVVLVELPSMLSTGPTYHAHPMVKNNDSLLVLDALSNDIQGARFQKHVMPFALVTFEEIPDGADTPVTTQSLSSGAVDVLRSPLLHEDIARLVGHVKDTTRPAAHLVGAPMAQNLVDSIHNTSEPGVAHHRPDQTLPPERKAAVETAIREWHFPAHDFNMDELTYAALFMLEHILTHPELEAYSLSRPRLMTLLLATRRQYKHEREVHYHNWRHAVDVTQSIYCFLLDVRICPPPETDEKRHKELNAVEEMLTPLDGLILLVSAIGHDVGHPGVNNAFLVACNHPLAQAYNDKSVLENYHCAAYSQLLRRHWPSLSEIPGFRATMISTILATDMQRHFEYMSSLGDLRAKVESSDANVDDWSDKDRAHARELILALLMKAADISNVARPFEVSAKWAGILMNEFAQQGELESELNIPTCLYGGPPNKEDLLAAAQSQKAFMSLFGFPLFQGIADVMPSVCCSIRELKNNGKVWDQKIEEEQGRRESAGEHEQLRFSSVTKDEVEKATGDHHNSEPSNVPIQQAQVPSTPTKRATIARPETSLTRHAAQELRQQLAQGLSKTDGARSSASQPGFGASQLSQGSSRRSSKDLALDNLQQLTTITHQNVSPGSRRGSADAEWHVHQSYPGSRRGSKDESLTTILVTSGGTPGRRSSPCSPGKRSPGKNSAKRQSVSQKNAPARTSIPSSMTQTTSSMTATTTQHSPSTQPSTQPSSLAPEDDDEPTPPAPHPSIPSTEDPFMVPGNWPNDTDGVYRAPGPEDLSRDLPGTPPTPPLLNATASKSESEDAGHRKGEPGIRESRSRSRLRGLKFWKKKRDVSGVEASSDSPSGSP